MFFSLLGKECKMWLKSLLFYVYIVILLLFYITQFDGSVIKKPIEGQKDYGTFQTTEPDKIMEETIANLVMEYQQKCFATYPVSFYKGVYPDEKTLDKIGGIIAEFTEQQGEEEGNNGKIRMKEGVSFSEFSKKMGQVAKMIGPGSNYREEKLTRVEIPMDYEQAKKEYEDTCRIDHITGSYARLFCDYIGIVLGILPVFFAVSRVWKDKKSEAVQVLYTKSAGSFPVVWARYLAMVMVLFIPVLLLSLLPLSQAVYVASVNHVAPVYTDFVKYSLLWLLPIVLFVTALIHFLAEMTGNMFPVLPGMVLWYVSIFAGSSDLQYVGKNLIPRFNTLGNTRLFQTFLPELYKNRLCYTLAAILLVVLTTVVYEKKRGGRMSYAGKISKHRKG